MNHANRELAQGAAGCLLAAVLTSLPVRAADNGPWFLAREGQASAVILVATNASAAERHAADELARYLRKATGAGVEQSAQPVAGRYPIRLATAEAFPRLAGETATLAPHGFLIHADPDGLLITARDPAGVLFGTYAFLEEQVGLRWFHPGEEGEYCPRRPTLTIGPIHDRQEPSFTWREVAFSRTGGGGRTVDTWDWIARNRMQPHFNAAQRAEYEKRAAVVKGGGHIFSAMVPDALFDTHPEYFGLFQGERRRQNAPGHAGQPCTTHPEVVRLAAQYVLDWFKQNPGGVFSISGNDARGFCECGTCRALDPPEERKRWGGEVSTRYFTFVNEVCKQVYATYPEAKIRTLAYMPYRLVPVRDIGLDPRVWIILCDHSRCFRHALDDPACEWNLSGRYTPAGGFLKMYRDWAAYPNPRGNFPYYNMIAQYSDGVPDHGIVSIPLDGVVAADMRFMHALGHRGWSIRVRPPDAAYPKAYDKPATRDEWRANFPWIYLQAKLAWKIDRDTTALLDDLCQKYYGPAAAPMRAFRTRLQAVWEARTGHFLYHSRFVELGQLLLASGALDEVQASLAAAEQAAAGHPPFDRRLAEERRIFDNSWLAACELARQAVVPKAAPAAAPVDPAGL